MTDEQTTDPEPGIQESLNTDDPGTSQDVGKSDDPANGNISNSDDPDTFPRSYVEKLRDESAKYRTRAAQADEANGRLLVATVASATAGILADPTDLPAGDYLDDDGWPDPEAIRAAADELVASKPHLGDRRPRGSIGQGAASEGATTDLAGILRSKA